jgi:hypothetical protein
MTHRLKLHPGPFGAAWDGLKPWEFRLNDRDFQVGHEVVLEEWDPAPYNKYHTASVGYTGRLITGHITYILREGYGIPEGYCIFTYERNQQTNGKAK